MPAYAVERLEQAIGSVRGLRVAVLGAAYRRGVKEAAFSGVFDLVAELRSRGAEPLVEDPLFNDSELRAMGFDPYHRGEPCDAAIIQTDHTDYKSLLPSDLPGVRGLLDGRQITDADNWRGVLRAVIGAPIQSAAEGKP